MPSNSFEAQPVPNDVEQEPTEYYARKIFRLQRDIDQGEDEKRILLDMSGHFGDGQDITPENLTSFAERFAALRRFQISSIDSVAYVAALAREAREGNQQFGQQIDIITNEQVEGYNEIEQLKAEQAEENK